MSEAEPNLAGLAALSHDVKAALRRLDPVQRRVLGLVYFERRTQEQVATELKLSSRAVARAVASGMQALTIAMLSPVAE